MIIITSASLIKELENGNKYNLSSSNTIFVGDSLIDKNAANITGLQFVALIKDNNKTLSSESIKIKDFTSFNNVLSGIG